MPINLDLLRSELEKTWVELSADEQKALSQSEPRLGIFSSPGLFAIGLTSLGHAELCDVADRFLKKSSRDHDCKDLEIVLSGRNAISLRVRKSIIEVLVIKGGVTGRLDWSDFASRFLPLKSWPSTDGRYENAYFDTCQHLDRNSDWEPDWFLEEYCGLAIAADRAFIDFLEQVLHPRVRNADSAEEYAQLINALLEPSGFLMEVVGDLGGFPHWKGVETRKEIGILALPVAETTLLARLERLKNSIRTYFSNPEKPATFPAFNDIRRALLSHPRVKGMVPTYIQRARNIDECIADINQVCNQFEGPSPAEYISATLNPVLDALEDQSFSYDTNYELCEKLGEGGFGIVYRLRHRLLNKDFALKILAPAFDDGNTPAYELRFYKEAALLLDLNHECIVRFYDVGQWGGRPCIRMEYVPGRTLQAFISQSGTLSAHKAAILARKLAKAIQHAHFKGILHRDIKPSNVLVGPNEFVKLLDFGLGVYLEDALRSRITRTGEGVAGGAFTAPELELNPQLLDPRSDIFSVGAVWYFALTGFSPVGPEMEQFLSAIPNLTSAYAECLLKCLRRPQDRFSDAASLIATIEALETSIKGGAR